MADKEDQSPPLPPPRRASEPILYSRPNSMLAGDEGEGQGGVRRCNAMTLEEFLGVPVPPPRRASADNIFDCDVGPPPCMLPGCSYTCPTSGWRWYRTHTKCASRLHHASAFALALGWRRADEEAPVVHTCPEVQRLAVAQAEVGGRSWQHAGPPCAGCWQGKCPATGCLRRGVVERRACQPGRHIERRACQPRRHVEVPFSRSARHCCHQFAVGHGRWRNPQLAAVHAPGMVSRAPPPRRCGNSLTGMDGRAPQGGRQRRRANQGCLPRSCQGKQQ